MSEPREQLARDYEVTVTRTYKAQAPTATEAVFLVLEREQGPDDFTVDEVTEVRETWLRPESRTVPAQEWRLEAH